MSSFITGSGVITNYNMSVPANVWFTTTETDEIIPIVENINGNLLPINDIQVFANATDILYRLCRIDNKTDKTIVYPSDVMFVGNGSMDSTVSVSFNAIQILGNAGQVFRFKGNFY